MLLYRIGRDLSWVILKLFGRLQVIGREHVPITGGALLAPNHVSYADPPAVGAAAPRPVWFMAKAELFEAPVLRWLIPRVRAFPVKPGVADRQALRRAHDLLTAGEVVNVFIEGRRSPDGRLLPPELGAAMMALRAGVPIVPVAIINSDRLLPRHGKWLRFTRMRVIFGEPLTFPHLAGKHAERAALREASEAVMRRIAGMLREHGAPERVPPGYLDPPPQGGAHEY